MTTAFLSHKSHHASAAHALSNALSIVLATNEIFMAEEIDRGDDWRTSIDRALDEAKCFLLLYTDPKLDWSWCFYEAGAFAKMRVAGASGLLPASWRRRAPEPACKPADYQGDTRPARNLDPKRSLPD